jgi:hypothetical protein
MSAASRIHCYLHASIDALRRARGGGRSDSELILASGLFDPVFYISQYPDVAAAGFDPALHYLTWGSREGRRPNLFFDSLWYSDRNPNAAGMNPLVHYIRDGQREGRAAQKRCVVYTAITGRFDEMRVPAAIDPELDYIVFADDQLPPPPKPWIRAELPERHGNCRLDARYVKTHPHILLPGYEISAWVDGAFQLKNLTADGMEAVSRIGPIGLFAHPYRRCAYDEAKTVRESRLDSSEAVSIVMRQLEAHGFPSDAGLVETGIVIRNHRDERVVAAMEEWWEMIRRGSIRDQLSINFVLWKQGLLFVGLPGNSRNNDWAVLIGHRAGPDEKSAADGEPASSSLTLPDTEIAR